MNLVETGWTLHPPTTPGRYPYREVRPGDVWEYELILLDGAVWVVIPHCPLVMGIESLPGEWTHLLAARRVRWH